LYLFNSLLSVPLPNLSIKLLFEGFLSKMSSNFPDFEKLPKKDAKAYHSVFGEIVEDTPMVASVPRQHHRQVAGDQSPSPLPLKSERN
jgi:hypothetical protein